jgi:aminopeptidase N
VWQSRTFATSPRARRDSVARDWFALSLRNLEGAGHEDARILWARSAIRAAESRDDVARLVAMIDGSGPVGDFELDQEMRWDVAIKAVAMGLPDGERLVQEQARLDPSDRGRRALLQAESARPTESAKAAAWERINGEGYGSFHLTRAAMLGFFWRQQADLVEPYVDRFFDRVRDIFETRDHPFARAYLLALYPSYRADPRVLRRSRELLGQLNGSLPTLSRQLAESTDELERQIRVRAFAEEE